MVHQTIIMNDTHRLSVTHVRFVCFRCVQCV